MPTERTPDGRFSKGNRCSPGRRPAVSEASYLRRLREAVDLDIFETIVCEVVNIATNPAERSSDRLKAASLLFGQLCPPSTARIHVETELIDTQTEFRVAGIDAHKLDVMAAERVLTLAKARAAQAEANGESHYRSR